MNYEETGLRKETVEVDFKLILNKDLSENEAICVSCGGSGLQQGGLPFGIKGYDDAKGRLFPFSKEVIVGCQDCYNGVQKKCMHCNRVLKRNEYECNCVDSKIEKAKERLRKDKERRDKAKKIKLADAYEQFEYVYVDNLDEYIEINDLEESLFELLEDLRDLGEDLEVDDLIIYGTFSHSLKLDAGSILESYVDDLHEEALERISGVKVIELQNLLDKWCRNVEKETLTYSIDFKKSIVVDNELLKKLKEALYK